MIENSSTPPEALADVLRLSPQDLPDSLEGVEFRRKKPTGGSGVSKTPKDPLDKLSDWVGETNNRGTTNVGEYMRRMREKYNPSKKKPKEHPWQD